MYEYKFINVPVDKSFKCKRGDSFEKCKDIIKEEVKNGWRLKQIVTPIMKSQVLIVPMLMK